MNKSGVRRFGSERGSVASTSLMILFGVTAVTGGLIKLNQQTRDHQKFADKNQSDRRINETAIQNVSQLINNGRLFYNSVCDRLEPTKPTEDYNIPASGCVGIEPKVSGAFDAFDCDAIGAGKASWIYGWDATSKVATVKVCTRTTEKVKGKDEEKKRLVLVEFTDYKPVKSEKEDATHTRYYAFVKSTPVAKVGERKFANLNGQISLGLTDGNSGLVGRHGAADTCFYMRPRSSEQKRGDGKNLAFRARSAGAEGKYSLAELEVRPEGANADEFEHEIDLFSPSKPVEGDYSVLDNFRRGAIFSAYKAGYRGGRSPTENWGSGDISYNADMILREAAPRKSAGLMGVMPNFPVVKDKELPRFQYFLYTVGKDHRQDVTQFDVKKFSAKAYKAGCSTSAKDPDATFCTKVHVPHTQYRVSFSSKCAPKPQTLPSAPVGAAPTVKKSDRALMTSCHPDWPSVAESIIRKYTKHLDGIATFGGGGLEDFSGEVTIDLALSALEVDDHFLNGSGPWAEDSKASSAAFKELKAAYSNFGSKFSATGQSVDDTNVIHVSAVDTMTADGKIIPGGTRSFTVYGITSAAKEENHLTHVCSYFKYYEPENSKACSVRYLTKNESKSVCRNNDGCFDELTMIRMPDGSEKVITALKTGESVLNPKTGRPAKITKIVIGPELKPLLNITVGDATVRVTDTHPFMTQSGWKQAKDIRKGDKILSAGDVYRPVTRVEVGERGRTVVNLALEGPADKPELHYVLADGVMTGDLVIQNMLEKKASAAVPLTR